jgi:two-component system nitrate/nitrite response regulator NarL
MGPKSLALMSSIRPCFLLVDDHALFRTGLGIVLSQHWPQAQVIEAATWGEGLRMLQTCQPDLILLDVHLPDAHALDELPALRALAPACPVLLMSAQADAAMVRGARSAGVTGFVPKSANTAALLEAVNAALGGQAAFAAVPYAMLQPDPGPGRAQALGGQAAGAVGAACAPCPPQAQHRARAWPHAWAGPETAPADLRASAVAPAASGGWALAEGEPADEPLAVSEPPLHLTPNQCSILRYLGRGTPNKAIARQMGMSETDVRAEVSWLTEWLGATSREEAHAHALARGLIRP